MDAIDSVMADKYQRKVSRWKKRHAYPTAGRRSGFLDFCDKHLPEVRAELKKPDGVCPEYNYRTNVSGNVGGAVVVCAVNYDVF